MSYISFILVKPGKISCGTWYTEGISILLYISLMEGFNMYHVPKDIFENINVKRITDNYISPRNTD
jgi:hypothetical protein